MGIAGAATQPQNPANDTTSLAPKQVTVTQAQKDAERTAGHSVQIAKDFDQFLTLLTTQMQNQDPLNPMDSNEFTNQIVQFSQVEQAINTNQKLDNLVNLQLASISSVALGYVGMDVSYTSSEMYFDGQKPVTINYSLEKEALEAKMNIYDEDGKLIYSKDVPKGSGAHKLQWDGTNNIGEKVAKGTYKLSIDAADIDEKPIQTTTVVSGNVRGIETQNGIVMVLVGDRAVALSSILNASLPEKEEEEQTSPATTSPTAATNDSSTATNVSEETQI